MKLVSFHKHNDSYGILTEDGIIDAGKRLVDTYPDLKSVLLANGMERLNGLTGEGADYAVADVQFLPVIPNPDKILCVGINYLSHINEMERDIPTHPWIFTRFSDSIVGHGEPMIRPHISEKFDYEGELAVVIGKQARYIRAADAMDYVAGYSCFNDGSIRDFQRHSTQFTPGKNFHHSGAFGPALVTADEVGDLSGLVLETRLNGNVMQHALVGDLCFDVPALIEYCSKFSQLEPGDVIVTGTPGGVGGARKPPVWMKAGDTIEVRIDKVGTLTNPIADEA